MAIKSYKNVIFCEILEQYSNMLGLPYLMFSKSPLRFTPRLGSWVFAVPNVRANFDESGLNHLTSKLISSNSLTSNSNTIWKKTPGIETSKLVNPLDEKSLRSKNLEKSVIVDVLRVPFVKGFEAVIIWGTEFVVLQTWRTQIEKTHTFGIAFKGLCRCLTKFEEQTWGSKEGTHTWCIEYKGAHTWIAGFGEAQTWGNSKSREYKLETLISREHKFETLKLREHKLDSQNQKEHINHALTLKERKLDSLHFCIQEVGYPVQDFVHWFVRSAHLLANSFQNMVDFITVVFPGI